MKTPEVAVPEVVELLLKKVCIPIYQIFREITNINQFHEIFSNILSKHTMVGQKVRIGPKEIYISRILFSIIVHEIDATTLKLFLINFYWASSSEDFSNNNCSMIFLALA